MTAPWRVISCTATDSLGHPEPGFDVSHRPIASGLLGPNILVYNSCLSLSEAQLDGIVDGLAQAKREGLEVIEVREDVHRAFNDGVQAALTPTVFNIGGCSSYYLDADG